MTITEHCQSIIESVQKIRMLCRDFPVSDLAKEAGLLKADTELQDLAILLGEIAEHEQPREIRMIEKEYTQVLRI
jgi:hypothetical protein